MEVNSKRAAEQLSRANKFQSGFTYTPVIWVIFALLAINALLFILSTASPHVRADVWRHLGEIIIPFLNGSEGLAVLWTNHHPSPLLHVIQIINLKLFGFRLDYDAFLGFTFQVLTTFLIVYSIFSRLPRLVQTNNIVVYLSAILIIAIQLGFNTLDQYTWPLVTTVQYLYFFGIVLYLAVDQCIRVPSRGSYFVVGVLSLVLTLANASYGTIFILSMITVLGLVYLLERRAVYFKSGFVIFSVWAAYNAALLVMIPDAPYRPSLSMWNILLHYLQHPFTVVTQFSVAIFAGLVDIVSIKDALPRAEYSLLVIGWILMLALFLVFFIYFKKKVHRITLVPPALMVMSIFFAGPALITRFIWIAGDFWGLAQQRYATTFKLVVIGAIWAMLLLYEESFSTKNSAHRRIIGSVAATVIGMLLVLQGIQVLNGWEMAGDLEARNRKDALAIFHASKPKENSTSLPFRVTGYGGVHGALAYLHDHRLNVFSDNFPGSPMVLQQVRARRLYEDADVSLATVEKGSGFGDAFATGGELAVSWTSDDTGIAIHSFSEGRVYVRVKVKSSKNQNDGIIVSPLSGNSQVQSVDLLRGNQNLFFTLSPGEKMDVETLTPATVLEMELRL